MLRTQFFRHVGQTSDAPMALEISHASGHYLFDTSGKPYLDLISGISVSTVGHGHPKVIQAIKDQADRHLHTLVYGEHIQQSQTLLAAEIAQTLPSPIDQVFFVNSGSEAVEGAMKLAKRFTGRFEIVSCFNSYHGSTHGALSLMSCEEMKRNFRPLLPGIRHITFGDESDLEKITEATAAVVIETVQGEAGVRMASRSYFQQLRQRCSDTGTLLMLDEIQSGFGRTGTFWAFEEYGIIPDVVMMAKGMGGGMPLGAFAASKNLMQALTHNPVLGHISTFGGHPVSCAASRATLQIIKNEKLTESVSGKENLFRKKLVHPKITGIRSKGLLMAVELGSFDQVLKTIASCLKNGLVTDWFLHCNTALRIAPPLTITPPEIENAAMIMVNALDEE